MILGSPCTWLGCLDIKCITQPSMVHLLGTTRLQPASHLLLSSPSHGLFAGAPGDGCGPSLLRQSCFSSARNVRLPPHSLKNFCSSFQTWFKGNLSLQVPPNPHPSNSHPFGIFPASFPCPHMETHLFLWCICPSLSPSRWMASSLSPGPALQTCL